MLGLLSLLLHLGCGFPQSEYLRSQQAGKKLSSLSTLLSPEQVALADSMPESSWL